VRGSSSQRSSDERSQQLAGIVGSGALFLLWLSKGSGRAASADRAPHAPRQSDTLAHRQSDRSRPRAWSLDVGRRSRMRVRCSSRTFADAGPRFWDSKTKIALIAAIAGVGVASSAFAQDAAPFFNISFPARCRALVRRQFRRTTESRFVAVVFIIRSCRRTRRPWFRVTTGNTIPKTRLLPEAACANESRADVGPPCFSFRAASRVDVRDLFQVSVDVLGKNADAVPYELIVNVRRERRICARQKARGRTLRSTPLCDLPAGATEASKSLTVVCAPRERRPS